MAGRKRVDYIRIYLFIEIVENEIICVLVEKMVSNEKCVCLQAKL